MEFEASMGFGFIVNNADLENNLDIEALYKAASEVPDLANRIEEYFEVWDDGEIDLSYADEVLMNIAEHHPDWSEKLTYLRSGDLAGDNDDYEAFAIVTAGSWVFTEGLDFFTLPGTPSMEDVTALNEFRQAFFPDVTTGYGWLMGASGS